MSSIHILYEDSDSSNDEPSVSYEEISYMTYDEYMSTECDLLSETWEFRLRMEKKYEHLRKIYKVILAAMRDYIDDLSPDDEEPVMIKIKSDTLSYQNDPTLSQVYFETYCEFRDYLAEAFEAYKQFLTIEEIITSIINSHIFDDLSEKRAPG